MYYIMSGRLGRAAPRTEPEPRVLREQPRQAGAPGAHYTILYYTVLCYAMLCLVYYTIPY